MPGIRTKDLIKVYRTGKSEVIALRGLDMVIGNEGRVAGQRALRIVGNGGHEGIPFLQCPE